MPGLKNLIVVLLILSVNSARAIELSSDKENEYWKEIVFNIDQAINVFNFYPAMEGTPVPNGQCYVSAEEFLGCVKGVQDIGAFLKPPISLIPKAKLTEDRWKTVKVLREFGEMILVEGAGTSTVALKPQERIAHIQADRDQLIAAGKAVIAKATAERRQSIDFRALVLEIAGKAPTDIPTGKLAVAVVSGYLLGLDAHSHINLTKLMRDQNKNADHSLTGIGIELSVQDGLPVVIRPIPDGPSEKLLKSGDVILDVVLDGDDLISLKGLAVDKVVEYFRGAVNTEVRIHVQRGTEQILVPITRAKIVIKNVAPHVVEDLGKKIGVIKLDSFIDENACKEIAAQVKKMENEDKVEALILDLRNNGGGSVDQAVCIGGLFAGKQPILYSKDVQDEAAPISAPLKGPNDAITKKPMAVLINGSSASASEVVSGALQGLFRAWIVGDRSFGKATVQTGQTMEDDPNLMLFQTTARFYVPVKNAAGKLQAPRTNQRVGVVPDFSAPFKPDLKPEELFSMREGDIFPYSLTAETKTWVPLRPVQAAVIQKCLDGNNRTDRVYASHVGYDYQLLKAQEVLLCDGQVTRL